MSLTIIEARDAFLATTFSILTAQSVAMVWPGLADQDVPSDNSKTWARITAKYTSGNQSSLSDQTGAKQWDVKGFLTVQVFCPIGDGGDRALSVVQLLINAYRSLTGEIWYRNPRPVDVGKSGAFYQVNFMVDFEYTQIQ